VFHHLGLSGIVVSVISSVDLEMAMRVCDGIGVELGIVVAFAIA
jgi:hypothetical protein